MNDLFQPFLLDGKVALATGASSGFGRHFGSVLARAGARVVLAARRTERVREACDAIVAAGGEAVAVTMDVKRSGDRVYMLGDTADELGGSEYYAHLGEIGANVPKVDAATDLQRYTTLNRAQYEGLIASCHDISDGGFAVAIAEKAFAGDFGVRVDIASMPTHETLSETALLYSESQSRLLVTVRKEHQQRFEALFSNQSCACIGEVIDKPVLEITGLSGDILISSELSKLKEAWQAPLREL